MFGTRRPGALPRRFRRPRVLVVGCGDIGLRLADMLADRAHVFGVVRRDDAAAAVRASGAMPLRADLDARLTLRRLACIADRVVYLAPPPAAGSTDPRTMRALASIARASPPASGMVARSPRRPPRWVYVSTTGIYGDRGGAQIDETVPPAPASMRARRRVDAEQRLRNAARGGRIALSILRAPGIYAADRLPTERLAKRVPAIVDDEDSYTNHVHADDLARAAWIASLRAPNARAFNVVDASALKMGQWFDLVADATGLPRPPRMPRERIAAHVSPAMLSFMAESRRISGERLARELRMRLRYPTVHDFFAAQGAARAESGAGSVDAAGSANATEAAVPTGPAEPTVADEAVRPPSPDPASQAS